ncbi:MAG TPA: hypothetical protein VJG31_02310 [Candidatus Nanoarchaeia archaeon]|nr:hypothetical protein [Candidatus Nanoarchaeia archaeon]
MVSQREKRRAVQFICDLVENSDNYTVLSRDERQLAAQEKKEVREIPRQINVIIPNFLETISDFPRHLRSNALGGIYTAPVFYKDGKTAFVRMVDRNRSWRDEKSLKRYTLQQINQMLHLRGIEKAVMENYGKKLDYYQPAMERLTESVRTFEMLPVELDYSHISQWDERYNFVQNRESIDYKLPEERGNILSAAGFFFFEEGNDYLNRVRIKAVPASAGGYTREYTQLVNEKFAALEAEAKKYPNERDMETMESALERIAIMIENEPLDSENSKRFRYHDNLRLEPIRKSVEASQLFLLH